MAKKSKKQTYEDEKKIIEELQKNARENIGKIAEKCGFSSQKAWRIMNNLEEQKKIWGYYTVIDNEQYDQKRYIILIRRSTEPIDDAISKIIDLTLHKKGKKFGITIECSSYLHGRYDWILIINANDLTSVIKFSNLLEKEYHQVISETIILEDIFSVKKCGIVNPNVEKLKDFT
jgi:DNA-binding Lrp family transcriptional regulator